MKKFNVLLVLIFVLVISGCGESSANEAESDHVIKIGSTPDGYPQVYSEDGEVKGFSADVYQEVFDRLGYEIEWSLTDWTGALASLETGKVDTLANFAVTPERQEKYNYTDPYYYSRAGLGVAQDNEDINSLEDVQGKRVANVTGSNYGDVLKAEEEGDEIELVNYDTMDVIISDVASGNMDAFVTGRETLLAQIQDKGIPLRVTEEAFGEKLVALPFAKTEKNDQLIEEINGALQEMREDGALSEISNEWFGEDVTVSAEE
ncbi:transporter substrate-binding domain-containing protein [Salinicoccus roseus]|uniref:transporter substrate-binding domain-containing protein n=1 Tax=Salinicoccus roseus TaxID=45670 RepID=UPI001CA762BD|nr:transporter substrate-binding domain-containing protein [Salinicoccus roseus]MBY8908240.1 transporter substrate-binding domain-containing protein [Salinicoccus roseus]